MTESKYINNEIEEARAMQKWFNERFGVNDSDAPFATDETVHAPKVNEEGTQIESGETFDIGNQQD